MCGKPSPEEELRSTPRLPPRTPGRLHHTQQQLHGLLHAQCTCSVHAMHMHMHMCMYMCMSVHMHTLVCVCMGTRAKAC